MIATKTGKNALKFVRATLVATACAAPAAFAGEVPAALGQNLAQGYIQPATQRFLDAATSLQAALAQHCKATQPEKVDKQFLAVVTAWSGIQFLRFGPLVADNRFERIFFWPDPRGMMQRQLHRQLQQDAPAKVQHGAPANLQHHASAKVQQRAPANLQHHASAKVQQSRPAKGQQELSAEGQGGLAGYSVAIQGLPALEYLLYREHGVLDDDSRQRPEFSSNCRYSQAIAANLAEIGHELTAEWAPGGSYAQHFTEPGPADPVYRNTQEVAAETIKALSTGIQFLRDVQLTPAFGPQNDSFNPRRLPFWRSKYAAQSMAATARGLAAFHAAARFRYAPSETWIDNAITAELTRAAAALDKAAPAHPAAAPASAASASASTIPSPTPIPTPIPSLTPSPSPTPSLAPSPSPTSSRTPSPPGELAQDLRIASLQLKNIKSIIDQDMAPAFGARVGFNALDGD